MQELKGLLFLKYSVNALTKKLLLCVGNTFASMLNKNLINEKVSASGLTKIFALLVGVLSVATVFDDFHRYLELFAHFKLQYLVASIIFSGVFFALREYQLGWVMIIVTTLNLNYVLPWYFSSKPVSAIDFAAEIKLVHANVHTSNTNYQALIDLVNKESPDILIAQEVNKQWIIALNKIEDILPYKQVRAREDNFGIAVYSKYPFDKSLFLISFINSSTITCQYSSEIFSLIFSSVIISTYFSSRLTKNIKACLLFVLFNCRFSNCVLA